MKRKCRGCARRDERLKYLEFAIADHRRDFGPILEQFNRLYERTDYLLMRLAEFEISMRREEEVVTLLDTVEELRKELGRRNREEAK